MDRDNTGDLTIDEIECELERANTLAYLQSLGIDTKDAWTLFKLLDGDSDGTVDVEEFIQGCMSLRCEAKAVHVAVLAYDQRNRMQALEEAMRHANHQLSVLVQGRWHSRPGRQDRI